MKQKTFSVPGGLLSTLYGIVVILGAALLHVVLLGLVVIAAAELYRAYRRDYFTQAGLLHASPVWLLGLSGVVFIGLQPQLSTQVLLTAAYGAWRWWLIHYQKEETHALAVAGVTELIAFSALFLAAAVWHLPTVLVVILVWAISYIVAARVLESYEDRAAPVLIAAWSLIVAECSWLFSMWLVTYILFNGILLVPQAAVVLTALGYCLSGIYFAHRRSQLSKTRLVEYLIVGLVLLVVVIAGTKWNGVI
jgi:hypothetical protein